MKTLTGLGAQSADELIHLAARAELLARYCQRRGLRAMARCAPVEVALYLSITDERFRRLNPRIGAR